MAMQKEGGAQMPAELLTAASRLGIARDSDALSDAVFVYDEALASGYGPDTALDMARASLRSSTVKVPVFV